MKFDKKILPCPRHEIPAKIQENEEQWTWALLERFKIEPAELQKAKEGRGYSKSEWRDFLLGTYGIQIERELSTGKVTITRMNFKTGQLIVLGEWRTPEIIHRKEGKKTTTEIHFKYTNLI